MVRKLIPTLDLTNKRTTEAPPKVFFFHRKTPGKPLNSNFARKHLCWNNFLLNCRPEACNFNKTETQTLVLSCEFCKIFKNTSERLLQFSCEFVLITSVERCNPKWFKSLNYLLLSYCFGLLKWQAQKKKNIFQYKTTDSLCKTFQIKNNQSLFMGMVVNYFVQWMSS